MVLSSPRPVESAPLERRSLAPPQPRAGEVLLRVRCCGVCHTDLHIVEGEMPPAKLPVVPGHQVVAVVERVGPGVTHPAPGARVGVAWLYASCGVCEACRRGEENLCAQIMFTGYHVDGGYAQYLVARADYVYPLPGSFDDAHAAPLLCAGIIGYRALRLSSARTGERLGLFGFGASAHLAIQVARYWERVLRSVSNSTRQDGIEFLRLAASIPLSVQVQQFSLTEANAVLTSLKRGEITGAAVLNVS